MMVSMQQGFDPVLYEEAQSKYILERVNQYGKLYLEFGGKLIGDLHAKRVLPGFDENAKIKVLSKLKEKVEMVICVYAGDIERGKSRGDFGTTYDVEVLRLIDDLRRYELDVNSVVITRYAEQPAARRFINKLENRGIKTYTHTATKGYPTDVDTIVSDEGYGANSYIETTKPIVVVTAPGPGSGKLATCLSQLYHEYKRGVLAGYSKFETFPVWNVPLKHPLNIAYEAATADLKDVNMIDSFHLEAYGKMAVNYNRDIEMFPVIRRIIEKITGKVIYQSPTDMGVNRLAFGIIDDEVVREASRQEILRRYFKICCEHKKGNADMETVQRIKLLVDEVGVKESDRKVVGPARARSLAMKQQSNKYEVYPVVALELPDGAIVTGKGSDLMKASAAVILNSIKHLAKLPDDLLLLSPVVIEPILKFKNQILGEYNSTLDCDEILIALSICAATNPIAQFAESKLMELRGCQAHSTTIIHGGDEKVFQKLGIDLTCDPEYPSEQLFYI